MLQRSIFVLEIVTLVCLEDAELAKTFDGGRAALDFHHPLGLNLTMCHVD